LVTRLKNSAKPITEYRDGKYQGSREVREEKLRKSTTMYIGNLSFYTTEEQCFEFFGAAGRVKQIVIGLDRNSMSPCGFGFVEYRSRAEAQIAMKLLNMSLLDGMVVRLDWDPGFTEERRYGRGKNGFQVRDEFKEEYDPNRPVPSHARNQYRDTGYGTPRGTSWDRDRRDSGRDDRRDRGRRRPRSPEREAPRSEDAKHDTKRQRVEDPEKANPRFRGEKEDKANDSE